LAVGYADQRLLDGASEMTSSLELKVSVLVLPPPIVMYECRVPMNIAPSVHYLVTLLGVYYTATPYQQAGAATLYKLTSCLCVLMYVSHTQDIDKGIWDDIEDTFKDAGHEIKKGFHTAETKVKKAVKTVGKEINKAGSRKLKEVEVRYYHSILVC